MIRTRMELQLVMSPKESNSTRCSPQTLRSAERTSEEPDEQNPTPETLGGGPRIGTPEEAIHCLHALIREARALREGFRRLSEGEEFGQPSARRPLRFGQTALDHAAAVFARLANLLESN